MSGHSLQEATAIPGGNSRGQMSWLSPWAGTEGLSQRRQAGRMSTQENSKGTVKACTDMGCCLEQASSGGQRVFWDDGLDLED